MAYTSQHERRSGESDLEAGIDYGKQAKVRGYISEFRRVIEQTRMHRDAKWGMTNSWLNSQNLNDGESLSSVETFFEGDGSGQITAKDMMRSALDLYTNFTVPLDRAYGKKHISLASKNRWMERYYDGSAGFKTKEYWINHQFPAYIAGWEKTCNDRKALLGNPAIKLIKDDPDVQLLNNESKFVDMHYEKRVDLLAKVRAAVLVDAKSGSNKLYKKLHAEAYAILRGAANEGIMSHDKVGSWLERIFKSGAKPELIKQFLTPGGSTSIFALMAKWREVRAKYDNVSRKGAPLKNPAIGLYMIAPERFLRMHYAQRKSWVDEADRRIADATNIDHEAPTFIRIRHALDLQDWEDAQYHIERVEKRNAESSIKLTPENQARLQSMKRYLTQMRNKKSAGKKAEVKSPVERAAGICSQIRNIVSTSIPSTVRQTTQDLLVSKEANRGINQFRWIVYNNKWCRDHNFLKYEQAKRGASRENSELTHHRAKNHIETGRRQDHSLDDKNSGQEFFRNTDYAKRRATLLHVDLAGSATSNLSTWLQRPQHPRELYWTTFCGHDNGTPMSENWHNDLFFNLTHLRSLTRELEGLGYRYTSDGPVKRDASTLLASTTAAKSGAGETSHAMAA